MSPRFYDADLTDASAQQESFTGSLRREMAIIFSVGHRWINVQEFYKIVILAWKRIAMAVS